MPEKVEAEEPAQDIGTEPFDENLRHHRAEPEESRAHMQAMAANKGEGGRQERAALRSGSCGDHCGEILGFQSEEGEPEEPRDQQSELRPELVSSVGCNRSHAAGEA